MNKKIILVDDNPITLFYNEDVIKEVYPNSDISTYERSADFIKDYSDLKFKVYDSILLFLDLNMPDYLGFEVLEEIEEAVEDISNLSVIILTSSRMKSDVERSKRFVQIKGYIEKPITQEKLKEVLSL